MSEASVRTSRASILRAWLTVVTVYLGCVGGLLVIARLVEAGRPEITGFVLMRLLFLSTAVLAFLLLGRPEFARAFGRRPTIQWLAIGPAIGLGCYAINLSWVFLTAELRGMQIPYIAHEASVWTVLIAPLLVAYTEELVFRGVLWAGLERLSQSSLKPILQTSVLFALLHLVNAPPGEGLWELPHRFVCGLALGWLRWRSGSLLPCVHAHFVVLALATVA